MFRQLNVPKRVTMGALFGASIIGVISLADAKSTDRQQMTHVASTTFSGSPSPNSKSILRGDVTITQGTMKATGTYAEIYTDANTSIVRAVITGNRAHIEQLGDDNKLVKADADRIDYRIDSARALLTGHVTTWKQDGGTASADEADYDVDTGVFNGKSDSGKLVELSFPPKPKSDSTSSPKVRE
jgi:lipopolysaccharide export system protein LptA